MKLEIKKSEPEMTQMKYAWSLSGKTKFELWIYETHIFELRNEEINVKKILAPVSQRSGFESRQAWFFQAFFSQLHKLR